MPDDSKWVIKVKYSPDQPRVSSGDPRGGQWTSSGGGGGRGTRTAQVAYAEHRSAINSRVSFIESGLSKHAKEQAKEPRHWGYAGDLEGVRTPIGQALDFLRNADEETDWGKDDIRRGDATAAYNQRRKQINAMLKDLKQELKKHDADYKKDDLRDWGWAGNMAHVLELMEQADDFINQTGEYAD